MTLQRNAGQGRRDIQSNTTGAPVGFQELEARLLLSASGLTALDNTGVLDIHDDHHDDHMHAHGIVAPGDDHGNNGPDSTFVQTDITLFGEIEELADQDWFNFQGQTGIQYTFETELLGIADTSLTLYDTDGVTVLAFDDDGGTGLASLLNWTAPSQGTYFIAVRGFDVETGSYSISMSDNAVPTGEIRGSKWDDLNMDGIRDPDEPGLEGWVIFIDENRNRKREPGERFEITDENGDYVFESMRPGTYTIAERPKPGWEQTSPTEGAVATSSELPALAGIVAASTSNDDTDGFNVLGGKWPQPGGLGSTVNISYSYSNLLDGGLPGGLTPEEIQQGIEEAFDLWSNFAPFKFTEMPDSGPPPNENHDLYNRAGHPDIRIGYTNIGPNQELAHAFGIRPGTINGLTGDIHFNTFYDWSIGNGPNSYDLIEVAVHEIGHSLGLDHEPMPIDGGKNAIMNPIIGRRYNGFGTSFLLDDDVAGIQSIYGEVQALLGVWTVQIVNPGEFVEDIDFGSFLNDDFGSDAETAEPINGNFINGNIESLGDVDWFSFEAGPGQRFAFETVLDDLEPDDIEDTVIRIIDQDGVVLIGDDDDSGVKLASKFPWIAPEAGTYYIEVSGFRANIGEYRLRLGASPVGDLDGDGFVGVTDLQIVLAFWNQNVTAGDLLQGDPSFDGFVGIDDLSIVLGNWNAGNQAPVSNQVAAADESTASVDQTAAVETAEPVITSAVAAPVTESRVSRQASATRQPAPAENGLDTRNAIAAWSYQPVQTATSSAFLAPSDDADEDSEGLLGLWSQEDDA